MIINALHRIYRMIIMLCKIKIQLNYHLILPLSQSIYFQNQLLLPKNVRVGPGRRPRLNSCLSVSMMAGSANLEFICTTFPLSARGPHVLRRPRTRSSR